jgi:hypothetical protein
MNELRYSFAVIPPCFSSVNSFFLQLHGATRYIVSTKTSLELVPCDGVDVHMGVVVRLPPVGCYSIELVRSKKDFLVIRALGDHEFFSQLF